MFRHRLGFWGFGLLGASVSVLVKRISVSALDGVYMALRFGVSLPLPEARKGWSDESRPVECLPSL